MSQNQDSRCGSGRKAPLTACANVFAAALLAALLLLDSSAWSAVIQSGQPGAQVQLGVNDYGRLIAPNGGSDVGVRFLGNGADGLVGGVGGAEGWGLGTGAADSGGTFAGYVNNPTGPVGLSLISATASPALNPTTFESVVDIPMTGARVRVTHNFHPCNSLTCPVSNVNWYEVDVTIKHQGGAAIQNLFYRRLQNWQVPPNAGTEYVTINLASAPAGVQGTFDEASSLNTQIPLSGTIIPPISLMSGAGDHGSVFQIPLGPLAVGQTKTLKLYYGAFATVAAATAALLPTGVQGYALAQPSDGAAAPALLAPEQNVFVFAFKVGNSSPVNTVPGSQQVDEGSTLVFNATNGNLIEVADESTSLSVALSVTHGKLTLASTNGLSVSGNGTASMTFTGLVTDINTALNGLTLSYAANSDYNVNNPASPAEALVITTTDTGAVPLSTTSTVPITVNPVNDPPFITVTSSSVNEDCLNNVPCQVTFTVAPGPPGAADELTQTISSVMLTASGGIWQPAGSLPVNCSPATGPGTRACAATVSLMPNQNNVTKPIASDRAFQIGAQDDGAPPATGQAQGTLSVTPVNDEPVIQITSLGPVNEDCGGNSTCQVTFTVASGPVTATDEVTQTINNPVSVTAASSTLFNTFANANCTPPLPASTSTCTASFTLKADQNNNTQPNIADRTLQIQATDNGPSSPLPNDNDATMTGVLSVSAVNDPPQIGELVQPYVKPDGPQQYDLLVGIRPGPVTATDEFGQAVTITAVSSNSGVVPSPAINTLAGTPFTGVSGPLPLTATMVYDPAGGGGQATITLTLDDNGPPVGSGTAPTFPPHNDVFVTSLTITADSAAPTVSFDPRMLQTIQRDMFHVRAGSPAGVLRARRLPDKLHDVTLCVSGGSCTQAHHFAALTSGLTQPGAFNFTVPLPIAGTPIKEECDLDLAP